MGKDGFHPLEKSNQNNSNHIESTSTCWLMTLSTSRWWEGSGDEGAGILVGLADRYLAVQRWPHEHEDRRHYARVHRMPAFFWKGRFSVNGGIWIEPFNTVGMISLVPEPSHLPTPGLFLSPAEFCPWEWPLYLVTNPSHLTDPPLSSLPSVRMQSSELSPKLPGGSYGWAVVLSCIDDIISCHLPVTPAIMSIPPVPRSPEPSLSCDESISSDGSSLRLKS